MLPPEPYVRPELLAWAAAIGTFFLRILRRSKDPCLLHACPTKLAVAMDSFGALWLSKYPVPVVWSPASVDPQSISLSHFFPLIPQAVNTFNCSGSSTKIPCSAPISWYIKTTAVDKWGKQISFVSHKSSTPRISCIHVSAHIPRPSWGETLYIWKELYSFQGRGYVKSCMRPWTPTWGDPEKSLSMPDERSLSLPSTRPLLIPSKAPNQ